jgi:hypothetical protein
MSFDSIPLWLVCPATLVLLLLSVETGFRIGSRRRARAGGQSESSGVMVAAAMGLLSFMLGFTFNSASGNYAARKAMVVEEVNAIGTTWLRAGFLPEALRAESRALLREYVDERVEVVGSGPAETDAALLRAEAMQDKLWSLAVEAERVDTRSVATGLFVQSLNDMIDVHLKRLTAAMRNLIPSVVWAALYSLAIIAMAVMGYQVGLSGSRYTWVELALVVSFTAVLLLIADLDRPQKGLVRVSQQAMTELQGKLHAK